jgi:hypothetical protein
MRTSKVKQPITNIMLLLGSKVKYRQNDISETKKYSSSSMKAKKNSKGKKKKR